MRLSPHNIEAEKALLCSIILDNNIIYETSLESEDFFDKENRKIFNSIKKIEGTIDEVNILSDNTINKDILNDISLYLITSTGWRDYYKEVKEKGRLRKLEKIIQSANQIIHQGGVEEVLQELNKINIDEDEKTILTVKDVIEEEKNESNIKIMSHNTQLDYILGGFRGADIYIVGGRPAMAKTSLALNFINKNLDDNFSVLLFSLEMKENTMLERIISMRTLIKYGKIDRGITDEEESMIVKQEKEKLSDKKMFFSSSDKLENILKDIRLTSLKYGLDIVYIDYLQLIYEPDSNNRVQELSLITRRLKNLSKELNIPIILLSQLSRNVDNRTDKRPLLSDLRDSGTIEQDAGGVIMLYREDYYDEYTENKDTLELIVRKNRHGKIGGIESYLDLPTMRVGLNKENI